MSVNTLSTLLVCNVNTLYAADLPREHSLSTLLTYHVNTLSTLLTYHVNTLYAADLPCEHYLYAAHLPCEHSLRC